MGEIPRFSRIDVRVLKALSKFASKEETRYYLCGVCLEVDARGTTYIGTDGHRLMAVRRRRFGDDPDNTVIGRFIVPTQQCGLFKWGKDDPTDAELYQDGRELRIQFGEAGIVFKPIDGHYPHWTRVVPRNVASSVVGQFQGASLASFQQCAKDLGLAAPAIAHDGPKAAAVIRFGTSDEAIGVIVPFVADDPATFDLPPWVLDPPTEPEEPELPLQDNAEQKQAAE